MCIIQQIPMDWLRMETLPFIYSRTMLEPWCLVVPAFFSQRPLYPVVCCTKVHVDFKTALHLLGSESGRRDFLTIHTETIWLMTLQSCCRCVACLMRISSILAVTHNTDPWSSPSNKTRWTYRVGFINLWCAYYNICQRTDLEWKLYQLYTQGPCCGPWCLVVPVTPPQFLF